MSVKSEKSRSRRLIWRGLGVTLLLAIVAGAFVVHRLRHRIPAELMLDIRAGVAARGIQDPDQRFEKYLEGRYGPQSDPANRQRAFVDFFNVEHIRAMQFLVKHSPENMRQANIDASARWVARFRESLTPQQLAEVSSRIQDGGGNSMLAQATAQYNMQDVQYRGQTAAVISELLKTLALAQRHE